jgi:hypothetical protein
MLKGWSFCIVTGGDQDNLLSQTIASIKREFEHDNKHEIIVVGNSALSKDETYIDVIFISFEEVQNYLMMILKNKILKFDFTNVDFKNRNTYRLRRTGWITRKKNLAAQTSRYDKLCLMHDYLGLEPGWKKGFDEYGDNWEVCMNKVLDYDGERYRDWLAWDYPGIEPGLLPYDKYTKYMYISGAYFCVKREFFLRNPLNEILFWGDGEDCEWSLRVRELTEFQMNQQASVRCLKMRNKNAAPYCEQWRRNTILLKEAFGDKFENSQS